MLGLFKSKKKTANATILVVDDEADLRNTIQTRLQWNKFNVITAANGQEGLEIAIREKPGLILLDNNMPIMTGIEMLAQLRNNPELTQTPVIMLTAVCDPQDIAAASSYEVIDYVTKPFDFADLMTKITNTLDNNK